MSGAPFNDPSPGPLWGGDEPESEELFATALVVSNPPQKPRVWLGIRTSLVAHVLVLLSVILIPIYWPTPLPETTDYVRALLYDPPPPPPPPLPKGASLQPKVEPAKPVTPAEKPAKTPALTAPIDVSRPEDQLSPEDKPPETEQFGSDTGSDFGLAEGMDVGVEGGVVGGMPGGVLGGVIGGTGTGPVLDYDQAPRPIKTAKPQYPQEAFVKKIEGTVVVEILIDANGRVVRARVVQPVPLLNAAAIQTAYQFVFTPALKRGRPVATVALIPVTFRIF